MSILTLTLNPALDLTVTLNTLATGSVNLASHSHLGAAGKGINVSRVLADIGHPSRACGFLGQNNDAAFGTLFEQYGIEDHFVRLPGDTRVNVKICEAEGRVTDINLPGLAVNQGDWHHLLARLDSMRSHVDTLVVAGSLPPGVAPEQLQKLIASWRERGKRVWLDTSGEALRAGIQGKPALIKPNLDELSALTGRPIGSELELIACARQLQRQGIEHVVVSNGADGVHWFSPQGDWRARVPRVKVVSTVGAGDSLMAGLCAGLLEGRDHAFSLRRAVALSVLAVTQVGVGSGDRQQLRAVQDSIEITQLEPGAAQ